MALPAILGSPDAVEQVLARASAEVRAQMAWTPKRMRDVFARLNEAPLLTEKVIDEALTQYIEAINHVRLVLGSLLSNADAMNLVETRLVADSGAITSLLPWPRAAALRSLSTLVVVFHLSRRLIEQFEPDLLRRELEKADFTSDAEGRQGLRAILLFFALLEALKQPGPVPGRAAALAFRADSEFHAMSEILSARDPALRLPWYFRDAPGAERAQEFASWREDLPLSNRPAREPTPQELEAWEEVKKNVDASRPHRPVFS